MSGRKFDNWLKAFTDYASFGEAPDSMYYWVGVSTLAGALRRKVWIDQYYFRWYPNFYVILVAPPGIVSKSTTADIGMRLLRKVPDIKFGPDVVTWQALIGAFASSSDSFELIDKTTGEVFWETMSPLTISSSEFGNLLNPQDKDMVDLLVNLWDGKQGTFEKKTKMSGDDTVTNPWINLIACTTPSWIAGNFPEYMIGGGFTSRCIFVYAEEKRKYVAYPAMNVPGNIEQTAKDLIQDLEYISLKLKGEYAMHPDSVRWGTHWYKHHYENPNINLDDSRFGGYRARKQTHIHKLAMIIAASQRDELIIMPADLEAAAIQVSALEENMTKVFARIGANELAAHADRLVDYVWTHGEMPMTRAFAFLHQQIPSSRDFDDILMGLQRTGKLILFGHGGTMRIKLTEQEFQERTLAHQRALQAQEEEAKKAKLLESRL